MSKEWDTTGAFRVTLQLLPCGRSGIERFLSPADAYDATLELIDRWGVKEGDSANAARQRALWMLAAAGEGHDEAKCLHLEGGSVLLWKEETR